jgi:hypothetical protein
MCNKNIIQMSKGLPPYLDQVRAELEHALLAMDIPSLRVKGSTSSSLQEGYPIRPLVEKCFKPTTDIDIHKRLIQRNPREKCLVEATSNSVRCSFQFKQQSSAAVAASDPIEQAILHKYMRFFQQRAEDYTILRRKPLEGYTISFLILNNHLEKFGKDQLVDVVLSFLTQVDKECSHVKISLNARARLVASEFMKAF